MTKLNLNFYKGSDLYSDGQIEDEMLDLAKSGLASQEIISNDNRWPILYHFSKIRQNILNWYPFEKSSSLLEIGAGCGAITEIFCKSCRGVTAVELSKKRSEINFARNKRYQNLEIIIGNLNDINFKNTFDYITLIGVLEYAKSFTDSAKPYRDFLTNIRRHLRPGGKLLIAIENKFGLKYWAGAREDHNGRFFDGIEGYHQKTSAETFGKTELETLIKDAGFSSSYFYYPFPDYKMPHFIFSDDCLPSIDTLFYNVPNYDQDRFQLFNENYTIKEIIKNNMFPFFSNSFLVEAY